MEEKFSTGIMLLGVGMITVFAILLLVVLVGRLLISLVNKYMPEETLKSGQAMDDKKIKAIHKAVDIITGGKGKVTDIKKI